MKNLVQRTISGSIYVILIIAGLTIHPLAFAAIFLLIGLLALGEFKKFPTNQVGPEFWFLSLFFIISFVTSYLKASGIITCSVVPFYTALVLFIFLFHLFSNHQESVEALQINSLAIIYIVLPLALTPYLVFQQDMFSGYVMLVMFAIIWINDVMAYATGILFGKNKLFKRVSPKKTWEGFIGGILFSGVAGLFIPKLLPQHTVWFWLSFSLTIAILASLGDLFESLLKRQAKIKDSGTLIPGHGGILDRIDSALFAIPVTYLFFNLFA